MKTVKELIELLSTFPPDSEVSVWCNYMQDAGLTVWPSDGSHSVDVMES